MSSLAVVLGVAMVLVALFDIITTVLQPEVESPLSNRLQRLIWQVLLLVDQARGKRLRRWSILHWSVPLMISGLIVAWLLLMMLGFALIYWPWIGNPAVFQADTPIAPTFLNALYFSGVTLATLGFGDIHPLLGVFQVVAVIEAFAGMTTITFSVSYVLSIYPTILRRRQAAAMLDAETAGKASALPMLRRYLSREHPREDELAARLRELGQFLLEMTESHEQHTVLYYSHSRQVQHSFLRMLVIVRNLVGALRYGLSPTTHTGMIEHPQLLLLEQSLHYSSWRLSRSLHIPPIEQPDSRQAHGPLTQEFEQMCASLAQIGLQPIAAEEPGAPVLVNSDIEHESDEDMPTGEPQQNGLADPATEAETHSPLDSYITFRLEVDPHIAAYAAASGYALEHATADYASEWWTGGRSHASRMD